MKKNVKACLIPILFACLLCVGSYVFAADEKPGGDLSEIGVARRELQTLEQERAKLEKEAATILAYGELTRQIGLYEALRDRPNIAKIYDDLVKRRKAMGVTFTDDQIAQAKAPFAAMERKVRDAKAKIRRLENLAKPTPTPGNAPNPRGNANTPQSPQFDIDTSKPWTPARQNIEAALNAAPTRPIEDLLEPVHTTRYDGNHLIWAPNPDGKTWDVIPIYYKDYGAATTLPIMDLSTGQVKIVNSPRGLNWHLSPYATAPNGKVYISTMKGRRVAVCIYDPASNEMKLDAVAVPDHVGGETHPLIRSTDGMIFAGGGHPSKAASLIMINPKTGAVTDYGACGPSHAPARCYNYDVGADDTHVYIASGKVPWRLLAVDRKTKKTTTLATTNTSNGLVRVTQDVHGVTAYVRIGDGSKPRLYWCHRGKIVPKDQACPWGTTGTDWKKAQPPKPEVFAEGAVPAPGKKAEIWIKQAVPGVKRDAKNPGWSRFQFDVPLHPMASHRLVELPDGRIFGTAGSYTGNFIFDPSTDKCIYTGNIGLSHYATAIHDNKIWMSGYPGSRLFAYDLAKPLTLGVDSGGPNAKSDAIESPDSNPRLLGTFGKSKCHKMYAAAVGASGTLYFGGRWMRSGSGGGLGWWDPKTNEEAGIWEIFSDQQIAYLAAAGDGKHIVVSTKKVVDTVLKKPTPTEGKLFVFDDATKKIVREITVEKNVGGPGPIAWAGANRIIGWTDDPADTNKSVLYGVDVERGEVAWRLSLPFKLPLKIGDNQKERWDFRLGPDGRIWTFMGRDAKTLVSIDPQTAKVVAITKVNGAGRLAFSGGDVYLSGSSHLRRIRGVVPR